MQKTPEFDALYDPVVTKSKGMLKTPEFDESYDYSYRIKRYAKNSRI